MNGRPPHLLHIFSTFVPAGPEMRTVRLIEAFGDAYRHSIVAMDGRTSAFQELPEGAPATLLESPPKAGSLATTRRLRRLIQETQPDLVLSYNWGAFDTVFATRTLRFQAHVHHEDGFNADESSEFVKRRVVTRKLLLPGVAKVVVPSENLGRIARDLWRLDPGHVRVIPNGVPFERFEPADSRPALRASLGIPEDAPVIGYVGHLRPEKNPARFLNACARVDPELGMHALVLGDGPERETLEAICANKPTLYNRVHLVGHQNDPRDYYRAMDIFCLSSDTEQMPVALVEAMASALPAVATDVGDVRAILPPDQGPFVIPLDERESAWPLAEALTELCKDERRRRALGAGNRSRVEQAFTFEGMVEAYREVYQDALGRSR